VVAERSASVMIHILVPSRSSYAESRRNPASTDSSFSARSSSSRFPQSPRTCLRRNVTGISPDRVRASKAPGVATIRPRGNLGLGNLEALIATSGVNAER
jgi:hypothetical protein